MKIFLGVLLFFLAFGWMALLLAATGLFYFGTVILSILAGAVFSWLFLPYASQNIDKKTNKIFWLVVLISLFASLAACHFATPTIFGGRDQGSIGTAAIYLSQNHNLKIDIPVAHDLFEKYGAGKSLNFPGFDYASDGNLFSRFPVGFTAFLAGAYSLFGLKGIQYANFVPLFFFLVIFWLILKEFFDEKIAFLGFLIATTFFPFLWFAKYALTETYMLFLVWTGIYFLIRLGSSTSKREVELPYFWIALAAFALSALVRIEGIIFYLLAIAYFLFLSSRAKSRDLHAPAENKPLPMHADSSTRSDKSELGRNDRLKRKIIIFSLALLAVYVWLNFPDLVDSVKNLVKAFLPNSAKESAPSANLYEYLARIFFNYNIAAYVVIGLVGIVWSILSSRAKSRDLQERSNKSATKISRLATLARNDSLIIFFITFPAFLYLLSPMITLDEPWFLRRFVFAVFPALIFYTIYIFQKFFRHKIFLYFVLIVLIAGNSVVSWRFFTTSENKDLLPQIEKMSQKFNADDLVLVDRLATGSGYSLMSEPLRTLFGKNAVYFFNAEDLKFVNQDRYKNIYLIAPMMSEEQKPWYADLIAGKSPTGAQIITNNFLQPSDKKWALAQNVESEDFVGIWKLK